MQNHGHCCLFWRFLLLLLQLQKDASNKSIILPRKKKHNSHFVGCGSSIRIRSRCSHGYAGSISWTAILIIFQTLLIVHLAHILFLLDCKFYLIACLFYQHNTILKTIFIIKNNQFLSLSHSQ